MGQRRAILWGGAAMPTLVRVLASPRLPIPELEEEVQITNEETGATAAGRIVAVSGDCTEYWIRTTAAEERRNGESGHNKEKGR